MPDGRPLPGWPRGMREEWAAEYVGSSVSAIRAMRAAGRFPRPVPIGKHRLVYLKDDLDRWLDERAGRAPDRDPRELIEEAFGPG